jgi:hypothetical protein
LAVDAGGLAAGQEAALLGLGLVLDKEGDAYQGGIVHNAADGDQRLLARPGREAGADDDEPRPDEDGPAGGGGAEEAVGELAATVRARETPARARAAVASGERLS